MTIISRLKIISQKIVASGGGGASAVWGAITGTLSSQTDLQNALDAKVDENTPITGATKTKITYDSKGLVTSGADATTADINPSTDRNYVTDAELTVIEEIVALHSGSVNIDFGTSGDFLTTTVNAAWVTAGHYGKIKCEVIDDGTDHLMGEAALGCVLASVNNIVPGVSFDILVVSQHDTWGRYVVKYNEII